MTSSEENTRFPSCTMDAQEVEEIRREAEQYAALFDKQQSSRWIGSLMHVLKETPPPIRRYAAIATIFYCSFPLPHGAVVRRLGAWFTVTCRHYQQPHATIPPEVRAWSESGHTLEELALLFQQGVRIPLST